MQKAVQNQSKGKTYATIVFLVILGIAVTVGSFALWNQTTKQTNFNALVTACLNLTIENESPEITMDYAYPVTEEEGLATEGYTFTVTNTCSQPVSYVIAVESVDDNSGTPFVGNQYIDISLDGKNGSHFSGLDTAVSDTNEDYTIRETRVLSTRRVDGNSSRTHTIRMWLDENTPLTEQNKTFISRVKLTGGQGIEADCYTVNSDGVLIDYDSECGKVAEVPATVNGHNVTRISSNAFKGDKQVRQAIYHDDWLVGKQDDDTVPTKDDFAALKNKWCKNTSNTSVNCTIDFSTVINKDLAELLTDESIQASLAQQYGWQSEEDMYAYIAENFGPDDYYVVIYYDGDDTDKINAIRDDAIDELADVYAVAFGITDQATINSHIYTTPPDNIDDCYESYYPMTYRSDEWRTYGLIGTKEPTNEFVNTKKLVINSLDLSKATNLVKIDNRAFSNMPKLTSVDSISYDIDAGLTPSCDIDTGLTSLTFGTNKKEIRYGGAVFAGAKLDTLNLYNSMKVDISPINKDGSSPQNADDATLLLGIFPCSKINTLNLVRADNNNDNYRFGGGDQIYSSNGASYYDLTHVDNVSYSFSPISGFFSLTNIGTLNIDNEIVEIAEGAFSNTSIDTLNLPSNLHTVGRSAFDSYNGNTLVLPSSLETIGEGAFWSYKGTNQNLVIPASVRTIGEDAFWRYNGATLTFNEGLQTLGDAAFGGYRGADFTLPSTIRNLGEHVFNLFRTGTIHVNMTQADFQANVNGTLTTSGGANNVTYLNS